MNILELYFLLFILKRSAGKGFWYQLPVTDKQTFKKIITVERTRKNVEKWKLDINFLVKCRESNCILKRLTNINKKVRNRYHRRLLVDEIQNKCKRLKSLNKQLANETNTLKSNITWVKSICISYSINVVITKYIENV